MQWHLKLQSSRLFTATSDQRRHQSSTSLVFVKGIHWWPVNSPHKGPGKMFPFDDIIMRYEILRVHCIPGQIERVGDAPLRKVLHTFGDWPVVTRNWNGSAWNLEDTIAKLRGTYNAPILIESWVATDDKNSSVHILHVRFENVLNTLRERQNGCCFADDNFEHISLMRTLNKISLKYVLKGNCSVFPRYFSSQWYW